MKKAHFNVLLSITVIFSAFLFGFFLGRQSSAAPVLVSAVVSDGPTTVTTAPTQSQASETAAPVFPININTATAEELTALPGIGEVLSQRIVDYRNSHGEFTLPEELMDVNGISEKRYEALKDLITTGG